ncbi:hypothetical protein [Nocardia sp. NPDC059228]|uniref:hypothetical protein n=1 Tax=Nocardia sp. NPDC059228 TaxID=3346777 RepID=UPI0036A28CA3
MGVFLINEAIFDTLCHQWHFMPFNLSASAQRPSCTVLADEVDFHLGRLGGGADPALTAALLVQAVEAQIHGAALEPPADRTIEDCVESVVEFWTRALSAQAT